MTDNISQPAGIDGHSFTKRFVTSFFYAAILIGCLLLGDNLFALPLLCAVLAYIGTHEFILIAAPQIAATPRLASQIMAAAFPILTGLVASFVLRVPKLDVGQSAAPVTLLVCCIATASFLAIWVAVTPTSKVADAAISFFGVLYLGIPLSLLIVIRMLPTGIILAPALMISVWAADVFAYLGGSLFGRHKLAPIISPKKSWEGLIAGTIGCVAVWISLPFLAKHLSFHVFDGIQYGWAIALVVGVLVSIVALIGDLFESRLKREAKVKDSGTILPGHGGILDRIDSTLAVSVLIYLILTFTGAANSMVNIP